MNSPKTRQAWILELLRKDPLAGYSSVFVKYGEKWGKGRESFRKDWNWASAQMETYRKKAEQAKERASIREEVKLVRDGLRTKRERLLLLQELVDQCYKDLTDGKTDDEWIQQGKKRITYRRKMTNLEYNQTRRTLKELQAEISKIEGDYAPEKKELSGEVKTGFVSAKQEKDFEEYMRKKYKFK